MPFIQPTDPATRRTRVHITGAPNSGKTTSLLTFSGTRIIISCPDEGGYDTIPKPQDDPNTVSLVYEADQLTKNPTSTQIVEEVRKTLVAIIKGEHGDVHTVCVEGLHKLHARILDDLSGGEFFGGAVVGGKEGMDPRVFGGAERKLFELLSLICHSKIPCVVVTSWDEYEADRKAQVGENWSMLPMHKLPALYGKTATRIMGEFGVTVHASTVKLSALEKSAQESWLTKSKELAYRWQTRPSGEVWGCAIKGDKKLIENIPLFIPQSWPILAEYLGLLTGVKT